MHPATPLQSPCRSRPLLAGWPSGVRSRSFCCCQPRATAPVDTLRPRDWAAGSGSLFEHPGTPAQSTCRSRSLLARWPSGVRSRPCCCCHRPGRRPRSTRCGRETGGQALDSCLSIQDHLRSRLAAADPCLLGGNPACGAGPSAAATGPGAGPGRHAAEARLGRRLWIHVKASGNACAVALPQQTPACSVAIRHAEQAFLLLQAPGAGPGRHATDMRLGQLALILCQCIRQRLRNRRGAADQCLLGGNPACGAGLSAAATGPGAGPGRHAAEARLGRRLSIHVGASRNACAIAVARQTPACSVAIRHAEQAFLLLQAPGAGPGRHAAAARLGGRLWILV